MLIEFNIIRVLCLCTTILSFRLVGLRILLYLNMYHKPQYNVSMLKLGYVHSGLSQFQKNIMIYCDYIEICRQVKEEKH